MSDFKVDDSDGGKTRVVMVTVVGTVVMMVTVAGTVVMMVTMTGTVVMVTVVGTVVILRRQGDREEDDVDCDDADVNSDVEEE